MTPCERSPSGAPVPVGATPTSILTVHGASKRMICQRSTGPSLLQLFGPERRRLDALHPPRHRHRLLAMGDVERRFRHRFVADRGAVHKGLVREIHQIVDDEAVVALHMDGLAVAGPGRIVVPVHVRHQRRIGQRGIAHPEPDEAMALDHRIGAHAGRRIDGLLRGHEGAAALRIVFQAVIAADDGVALEPALRQRHQPVPAGVFQRSDLPVGLPVHHDMLAADRARQQRVLDLGVPARGVPGVHGEGFWHGHPPVLSTLCIHNLYV